MAKIFRTEELSVNGDFIRISAEDGNLIFKDSSSNVVTSTTIRTQEISSLSFKDLDLDADVSSLQYKDGDLDNDVSSLKSALDNKNADVDSDISSLQSQRDVDEAANDVEISSLTFKDLDLDADVSSLQYKDGDLDNDVSSLKSAVDTKNTDLDSDVSSLQAQRDVDEAANDVEISSLTFKDLDLDADVSSLAFGISQNDTYAAEQTMSSGVDSVTHTIAVGTRSFSSQPRITATLVGGADDPIIGVMITGITWTDASTDTTVDFVFSDDLPNANYKLQVFAAV